MTSDIVISTWGGKLQCYTRLIDRDATTGDALARPWWLVESAFGNYHFNTLLEAMTWCEPITKSYRRFRTTNTKGN